MQILEPPKTLRTFTVEQYKKLELWDRSELLGGLIYDVTPRNEPHVLAVTKLNKALTRGLGDEYSGNDAPEIDIAIVADRT